LQEGRTADRARLEELANAIRALGLTLERLPEQAGEVAGQRMANRLSTVSDRLAGLDARLDAADARLAGIDENVGALHAPFSELAEVAVRPDAPPQREFDGDALVERITGALRREAELLTQRVAALAVGVEAARSMIEQHVEEAENSLGRKAGEVTRRLAADFGIRKSKPTRSRRERRELGRGSDS
jgi:hypothetical protein